MMDGDGYDVVIIGAGLGGLLCGAMLAKRGKRVVILEKNKQIGGCLQTFAFEKKVFDSCVHYIGGLGEGHTLHRIFRYAGIMEALPIKPFSEEAFDKIYFGTEGIGYPLAVGEENFVKQLSHYFPDETTCIEQYIAHLKWVAEHFPLYQLRDGDPQEKQQVAQASLSETLQSLIPNPKLRAILTGNALLYAGREEATPLYLHALVEQSYLHSSHKIVPGSSVISKLLHREILRYGGAIFKGDEVRKIIVEGNLAKSALTAAGRRVEGRAFIFNLHPACLASLIDSPKITPAFHKRMKQLVQTPSCYLVHAILKPQSVAHKNYNVYWHPSYQTLLPATRNHEAFPAQGFAVYSTEDVHHPGFSATISVMCYGHADSLATWEDTYRTTARTFERGDAYEQFKEQIAQEILATLTAHFPEYKNHISSYNVSTPLTFRDYLHTPHGALYGIAKDVNRSAQTSVSVRTKISNLYLTGQNVNMHGVLGVAITAVATCGEMEGLSALLRDINAA